MAKDKTENTQNATQAAAQGAGMTVHTQYVRDFSFENPNAPESLGGGDAPKLDANITMQARELDKEKALFEVVLKVSAQAERDGKALFLAEVEYGVVASVNGIPEEHRHPLLLIEGPKLAFPFVRQILANALQNGGFPPLLLNPVNFEQLYKQQFLAQKQAEQAAEG